MPEIFKESPIQQKPRVFLQESQSSLSKTIHSHPPSTIETVTCPHCGSSNVYGMSRVVGYYSRINNWNNSKKQEFFARQKGKYKL